MCELPETFELVTVQRGVRSIRSRVYHETFHPVVGPLVEARTVHLEQQRLVERAGAARGTFVIWDVGLGAAANAIAVLEAFNGFRGDAAIELHSFDRSTAALEFGLQHAAELAYLDSYSGTLRELLARGITRVGAVSWVFHSADFSRIRRGKNLPAPRAILYDPYSPRANPDMWTLDHFTNLRASLDDDVPCLLTNTTRSTAVRVTLLLAGFFVGRGAAIGDKEETTVAGNQREIIGAGALDRDWLRRVEASSASAPLRGGAEPGRICPADLDALRQHPQFAIRH